MPEQENRTQTTPDKKSQGTIPAIVLAPFSAVTLVGIQSLTGAATMARGLSRLVLPKAPKKPAPPKDKEESDKE